MRIMYFDISYVRPIALSPGEPACPYDDSRGPQIDKRQWPILSTL
jgi:hypothetical protein